MASDVITLDGPAGVGKSTTAKAVAEALDFAHLDSGALYRAVTLGALDAGVPLSGEAIVGVVKSLPVKLVLVDEVFRPEAAGVDVSVAVRSDRVTQRVSAVAALPAVRAWVDDELRRAAALHPRGVVADGRDMGTVVFPDAPVKVFITASAEARARRRARQVGGGEAPEDLARLQQQLARRDEADSTRSVAPLVPAPDAVILDTTGLTFLQQVDEIVRQARNVFS